MDSIAELQKELDKLILVIVCHPDDEELIFAAVDKLENKDLIDVHVSEIMTEGSIMYYRKSTLNWELK